MRHNRQTILELNGVEARKKLLEQSSYINFELPSYFNFTQLIENISSEVENKQFSELKTANPGEYENVNYKIFDSKDGKYGWRVLEIIHPILYVYLVQQITRQKDWSLITKRLKAIMKKSIVNCASIPIVSFGKEKDKSKQIKEWLDQVERQSIELSLDYKYFLSTDIQDCYGSIYTHLIPRAIHGIRTARHKRKDLSLIGNTIDKTIQSMHYAQTNGIPQGSLLMDFLSEVVLLYIDELFSKRLQKEIKNKDFRILRYRDDYRIFSNDIDLSYDILKILTEILAENGLHTNIEKTKESEDIISSSMKEDKLFKKTQTSRRKNFRDEMLRIYNLSKKYPNSGLILSELNNYSNHLYKYESHGHKIKDKDINSLISMMSEIIIHCPKVYSVGMNILSLLLVGKNKKDKKIILKQIYCKLQKHINNSMRQIWLQRLFLGLKLKYPQNEKITLIDIVSSKQTGESLWNSEWASRKLQNIIKTTLVIDNTAIKDLDPVIQPGEFSIFNIITS